MEALLYTAGVLIFLGVLGASIALHEIGHLVPAKLFGVKVTQYMVGFGPTVWSMRRGDTEYGLKWLPLGGYIRMIGMFPPRKDGQVRNDSTGLFGSVIEEAYNHSERELAEHDPARAFYKLAVWKKLIIMLGGPTMNLVIATVLLGSLVIGIGDPRKAELSTTLQVVSECIVPAGSERTVCGADDPATPAAEAGLLPGDTITAINGNATTDWDDLRSLIRDTPGESLELTIARGEQTLNVEVTPRLTERPVFENNELVRAADGSVVTEPVGFLGVSPRTVPVPGTAADVPVVVWDTVWGTTKIIAQLPQRMVDVAQAAFGAEERDPTGPIGIVGVGRLTGEATSMADVSVTEKTALLLSLLGGLNVALFVFNLIPLLPFDGGHAAGALWEGLRKTVAKLAGRADPGPVDVAKAMPLTYAVSFVLVAMSLMLLYADIVRPVSLRG